MIDESIEATWFWFISCALENPSFHVISNFLLLRHLLSTSVNNNDLDLNTLRCTALRIPHQHTLSTDNPNKSLYCKPRPFQFHCQFGLKQLRLFMIVSEINDIDSLANSNMTKSFFYVFRMHEERPRRNYRSTIRRLMIIETTITE